MIYYRLHSTENGNMLAMCDSTLVDRVLSEGEVEINLRDYSDFYKGQLVSKEAALDLVEKIEIISANIVGEEAVEVCLKKGLIKRGHVKRVEKVPYAQAFRAR